VTELSHWPPRWPWGLRTKCKIMYCSSRMFDSQCDAFYWRTNLVLRL